MPPGSVPAFVIDGTIADRLEQEQREREAQPRPEDVPDFDPDEGIR